MYKCPICDYTDEKKSSVKAHLTASVAGDHHGMSGRNDHQMIEETDSDPGREPDSGPEPEGEPTEQADSDAELSSPAWPDGGDGEPADETVCESCGNDMLYESDAVLNSKWGKSLSAADRKEIRDADAVCLDCGSVIAFE